MKDSATFDAFMQLYKAIQDGRPIEELKQKAEEVKFEFIIEDETDD